MLRGGSPQGTRAIVVVVRGGAATTSRRLPTTRARMRWRRTSGTCPQRLSLSLVRCTSTAQALVAKPTRCVVLSALASPTMRRAVHDILGDLKAQARAMGTEIDDQNEMLEGIEDKTSSNNDRVQAANTRAAKLLKNA